MFYLDVNSEKSSVCAVLMLILVCQSSNNPQLMKLKIHTRNFQGLNGVLLLSYELCPTLIPSD